MAADGIIGNLISGGIKGIGDAFSNIVEKFKADPTKVAELSAELEQAKLNAALEAERIANEAEKIRAGELQDTLKDLADARNQNIQIQNSDKASWLSKNVAYCIDIFVMTTWGFITIYLLCVMLALVKKEAGVDYTAVTAVWGGVTAFAGNVLQFHRGSSVGSRANGDTLRKLVDKQ